MPNNFELKEIESIFYMYSVNCRLSDAEVRFFRAVFHLYTHNFLLEKHFIPVYNNNIGLEIMALSKYTILVAEYTPTDMLLLKILLKATHCHLLTTSNSIETLELAKTKCPDLLLLDMNMPEINGIEIAERLRQDEKTKGIPILFMVNSGEYPILTAQGTLLNEKYYIEKPLAMKILVKRIQPRLAIE